MWAFLFSLTCLAFMLHDASAQGFHQCKMPDGRTVLTNEPCPGEEPKSRSRSASETAWTLLRATDAMTDKMSCVIESPSFFGQDRENFVFVSLRIVQTPEGFFVGLYSQSKGIMPGEWATFHNDIDGLGLRIDTFPFIAVDRHSGSRILAFTPEKSAQIIETVAGIVRSV